MLIFDRFNNQEQASKFMEAAKQIPGKSKGFVRTAQLCDTQEQSNEIDLVPFELEGNIVLVNRDYDGDCSGELELQQLVTQFGGEFAGT